MIYPPAIATIVTRFSRLKQLKDQADHIAALDRRLKTCLSGPLAAHVRLATVRDGCLVMQADIAGERVSIVLLNSFGKLTPFGDSNRLRDWLLASS